jgi:hypothetical protein
MKDLWLTSIASRQPVDIAPSAHIKGTQLLTTTLTKCTAKK